MLGSRNVGDAVEHTAEGRTRGRNGNDKMGLLQIIAAMYIVTMSGSVGSHRAMMRPEEC